MTFQLWKNRVEYHLGFALARSWSSDAEAHFKAGMTSRNFAQRVLDTYAHEESVSRSCTCDQPQLKCPLHDAAFGDDEI